MKWWNIGNIKNKSIKLIRNKSYINNQINIFKNNYTKIVYINICISMQIKYINMYKYI